MNNSVRTIRVSHSSIIVYECENKICADELIGLARLHRKAFGERKAFILEGIKIKTIEPKRPVIRRLGR